jgi:outer membrane protein assembly factor BamE (lipoprotein component of BamABCDE complex)
VSSPQPARRSFAGLRAADTPIDNWFPLITQFGVYKLDINQGNFLSQDMVDRLKVSQTRQQVRLALGTLVASPFRRGSVDYVQVSAPGPRWSTASSPSTSRTTSSPGGKATKCRSRRRS